MKKTSTSNKKNSERKRKPIHRTAVNPDIGLTNEQVKTYRDCGWENVAVKSNQKTTSEIIKSNLFTYFNLIFLILALLLIMVGSFRDLTFLVFIISNVLIGIIQELNAKKTLEKMTIMNAPKVKVVRSGKIREIASEKLVIDDIIILEAGCQIPADAIVVDGEITANESLLTGESDDITKVPGDLLMSGSFVVSGVCRARLDKVGADSYISKLTIQAKASKEGEQSEMIRSLNKLIKLVGIIIIPIGILLFYQQYVTLGSTLTNSIKSTVAAIIGMIPEGLYLLSTVTMAVGVIRLAFKQVLVHDMKCIETLARVDVLCVDKTGTITEPDMSVNEVIPLYGFHGSGVEELEKLLGNFAGAMSKDNITMAALQKRFTQKARVRADRTTGFSSAHKYSSAVFSGVPYVLGAPEFVLREQYDSCKEEIEKYSAEGYRVLVFVQADNIPDGGALTGKVTPLCLVTMSNPIRENAVPTFHFFSEQGVRIIVISGDNPITVSKVAREAGIENASRYVDASTLTNYEMLAEAIRQYTVFGRVTPDQKRLFVKALKSDGHTVAMTGDGVNDVLALKDADCSVAMASGSEAAASVSQLVLLESDFSRMPDVVMEGRRVVNNLERSGSLFLVKNIFSLLLSLFSIVFAMTYPLEPSQISLISMFTIGLPGFLLSQIPNNNLIKGKFLPNILLRALPAGLTNAIIVGALLVYGEAFNVGTTDISTASTILLAIVGFMILFRVMRPMSKIKSGIFAFCIAGFLFCLMFLQDLFAIYGMSIRCILLFVIFSIITEPVLRYLSQLIYFIANLPSKMAHRKAARARGETGRSPHMEEIKYVDPTLVANHNRNAPPPKNSRRNTDRLSQTGRFANTRPIHQTGKITQTGDLTQTGRLNKTGSIQLTGNITLDMPDMTTGQLPKISEEEVNAETPEESNKKE
ncbi:MAG: HAD-IC family P-type ATPase [Eubacterium sp.]|nr:HAD-IC family P-type ATPase [Eubacterium sp.]